MLPLPTPHLSHLSSHTVSKDFQLHRNCLSNLTRVQQQLQPAQLSRNHASPEHAAAVTQPSPDSQRVAEQGTASTSGRNPELPTYADRTARAMVAMDTAVLNGAPKQVQDQLQHRWTVADCSSACDPVDLAVGATNG